MTKDVGVEVGEVTAQKKSSLYDRVHDGVGFTRKDGFWVAGIDEAEVHVDEGDGFWRIIMPKIGFFHECCGERAEERAFGIAARKARERAEN